MAELTFGIAAYAASGGGAGDESDVSWPSPGDATRRPPVPALLRRRIGPIGQAALRVAWTLPRAEDARLVFASRHGEFDRTLTMLEQVADKDGPSPADFSLGVHNALPGLLSVCMRNHGGHTALAAGIDSFGFGLMEAAVCLAERPEQPVILVYYDAALPPGYPDATPARTEAALALGILLMPPSEAPDQVAMAATPAGAAEPGEAAAAVFLRFLRTAAPAAGTVGERMRWDWRRA
ncbi:beta-ketoacyl synthase chain length factor [Acidisphaera sp. S103]|uniref:beta-ketoacyl synthase chain length factor n=1 Tax=Acidisphaera sp. S103 TaxID=1747223 RepID=UPI00131AFB40|nr:beta-ketoacyl synthase chain length factor [Acidisphaera sp. S103]